MLYLILPDIHLEHEKAEKIIKSVKPDKTIFLGDYFDDFGDTPEQNQETAHWLKDSLSLKCRFHLYGNHDVHYINSNLACSGYTDTKFDVINRVLVKTDWLQLQFFYNLENQFLLTHAGLDIYHCPQYPEGEIPFDYLINHLQRRSHDAKIHLFTKFVQHEFFACGMARGGLSKVGHILWNDFIREFKLIEGINQIFGHTHVPSYINKCIKTHNSENYCLDTHPQLQYYATFNGRRKNKLIIHKTK